MAALLPTEILQVITQSFPCRNSPIRDLATFYNGVHPSPVALVAYGFEQTSKLGVITAVLEARSLRYVVVKSRDCLSQRHLLSKIFAASLNAFGLGDEAEQYDRLDNLNTLVVNLERLLNKRGESLVLVLDGIDKQKGAGPTLLPALARLGDSIPHLCVLMTSSSPRPLRLQKTGVPYVHFGPYSRAEAVYVVTRSPPTLHPPPHPALLPDVDEDELSRMFAQFAVTVYDSLVSATSSTSISTFRHLCERLWPRFIWPFLSGESPPGKAKSWDFARLIVRNRGLFQTEGENALIDRLQPSGGIWTFDDLLKATKPQPSSPSSVTLPNAPSTPSKLSTQSTQNRKPPLLKHFATLLLLASYLASHTSPKYDIILFSRLSSSSKKVRKTPQKKKIFQSPSKNGEPAKAPKSLFDAKMGVARPFGLERLIAILRAIHPDGVPNRKGVGDRVYRELGELERLRLVVKSGGVGGEDMEEKWKVNVSRDWVVGVGKLWGMGVAEYEMEQD